MPLITSNPDGISTIDNATPIVLPASWMTSSAIAAPALNYSFLSQVMNGWYDALGYSWVSFHISASAAVTDGILSFECTNDPFNAAAGVPMPVEDITHISSNNFSYNRQTSITLSANYNRLLEGAVTARYIRVRVSTAVSAGTVTVATLLKQLGPSLLGQTIGIGAPLTGGGNPIGKYILGPGTNLIGYAHLGTTFTSVLMNNQNVGNATTPTVAITSNSAQSVACSYGVSVSSISSGIGILSVALQESPDNTNWHTLYQFEPITVPTITMSPMIRTNHQHLRYQLSVTNVSGTPIFATTMVYHMRPHGANFRNFVDRTTFAATQTAGVATSAFYVQGTTQIQMGLTANGASLTASAYRIELSDDTTNWWTGGNPVTTSPGTVVSPMLTHGAKWARITCTTSGSSQTMSYVTLSAIGP